MDRFDPQPPRACRTLHGTIGAQFASQIGNAIELSWKEMAPRRLLSVYRMLDGRLGAIARKINIRRYKIE